MRPAALPFLPAAILLAFTSAACTETCGDCVKEKCQDLVDICDVDPDCGCMVDCMGRKGIPGVEGCLETCGLAERPADFVPVEECVATACPDSDECSTPAGYTPPLVPSTDDTSALDAHGGGGALADCGFDDALAFDPEGETLQLESLDGNVCARISRRDEGSGSLANTEWTLLEMQVGPLGGVSLVDAEADLCWYSSHHNFFDWAHAWDGAVHYDLKLKEDDHGGPRTYALFPYEQGPLVAGTCASTTDGTTPIGEPITMYPHDP